MVQSNPPPDFMYVLHLYTTYVNINLTPSVSGLALRDTLPSTYLLTNISIILIFGFISLFMGIGI